MLWECANCTALFMPGAAACPQCGGLAYREAPGGGVETGAAVLTLGPPADAPAPDGDAVPKKVAKTAALPTAAAAAAASPVAAPAAG